MERNKKLYTVVAGILFLITGLILSSGIFTLTESEYYQHKLDYFYFISVNVLFWFPLAYFINQALNFVLWTKLLRIAVGKTSQHFIKDFTASLIYTIAIAIIFTKVFWINLSFAWLLILLIILLAQTLLRPNLLAIFSKDTFSRVKPFNHGDWISIKNNEGTVILTGEVYNISRGSVFIKTEDNNLVFVSMETLNKNIIENFNSLDEESRFRIELCFDYSIPSERIKRIMYAGAKQALQEINANIINEPKVIVKDSNEKGILYELQYWIKPWKGINPTDAKDKILSTIINNLTRSGISQAYPKSDLYLGRISGKETDLHLVSDKKKILSHVDLFEFLNDDELEQLANSIIVKKFRLGEVAINEGDGGQSMLILAEGLLNVFKKNSVGKDILVGKLKPGDFFGEMSLLTGELRSATITADSDCLALELTKEIISPIIKNRVSLIENFGAVISKRHEINLQKIQASEVKSKSVVDIVTEKIKSFFHIK